MSSKKPAKSLEDEIAQASRILDAPLTAEQPARAQEIARRAAEVAKLLTEREPVSLD